MGAIYYPRSEFVCFTGSLENKTIDIKSIDTGNAKDAEAKIELSLHRVSRISSTDQTSSQGAKKQRSLPTNELSDYEAVTN